MSGNSAYNIDDPQSMSQFLTQSGAGVVIAKSWKPSIVVTVDDNDQNIRDNKHESISRRSSEGGVMSARTDPKDYPIVQAVLSTSAQASNAPQIDVANMTHQVLKAQHLPSAYMSPTHTREISSYHGTSQLDPTKPEFEPHKPGFTTVQAELLQTLGQSPQDYHDKVVADWKEDQTVKKRLQSFRSRSITKPTDIKDSSANMSDNKSEADGSFPDESTAVSAPKTNSNQDIMSSPVRIASPPSSPPEVERSLAATATTSSYKTNNNAMTEHKLSPPESHDNAVIGSLKQASDVLANKLAKVVINPLKTEASIEAIGTGPEIAKEGHDREHAMFFTSWGAPEHRDKPKSQIRKIIISGLPPGTDLTVVQSIVHGGAIDTMSMNSTGTSAYVTFTTGEACNKYYDQYPNGLTFKVKGRTHNVFVDKNKDVDVISGVLEGQLAAGASRVIKVIGGDEDWTMRALQKIAEGGKANRKVESIVDSFRQEVRTIIFRFASIADAVVFRSALQRDQDWEYAEISFMQDPCEKATGVHFD